MDDRPLDGVEHVQSAPVIALLGPTAVGKSRHALELCEEFDGVVVSADSRQIYRYMDIGTAKPSPAERALVPHYMLDVIEPSEIYSAQRFASEAEKILKAMSVHRTPVFVVGGTGFYASVLLDRRSIPAVSPDPALREELRVSAARVGTQGLHARLQAMDPASASRIHPNNLPRIIRALEIVHLTGRPVPSEPRRRPVEALRLGLELERSALHRVADRRIDDQIRMGLVQEVETLLAMGYAPKLPALDGLGYRQMIQYLKGESSLEEAIERYRIATHQYIRRQLTWFRRDDRISWLPVDASTGRRLRELVRQYLTTVSAPASRESD